MSEEEIEKLDEQIKKLEIEYIRKHRQSPKYIKMPLWILHGLKKDIKNKDLYINYTKNNFEYKGYTICETISISEISEIELF